MQYIQNMKKLPLAITTFEKIRDKEKNYLYVDKTSIAQQLIESGEYYFLSRPRRFGKSLFLDTLSDLFQAKQSLFEGLAVYDSWDWSTKYSVIKISLNTGDFSSRAGIEQRILDIFSTIQKHLQVTCKNKTNIPSCFSELIENIYDKYQQKVVILIDEYDKPILDNIDNKEQALIARNILKSFYSVIKDNDQYLKFVFITGVSKFSKMNLFSGLNNLTDITTMSRYATICGYTHDDIKTEFKEHLAEVDLEKLKRWYNGYNYLGKEADKVYNPYDILLFITNNYEYENYWWSTGNPAFLIKKLEEQKYYIPDLENITASKETLDSFDVEHIDLIALLWQTGYLTFEKKIIEYDDTLYKLKLPNREIQASLNTLFIKYLTEQTTAVIPNTRAINKALIENMSQLEQALTSLFASIPYNNYTDKVIENYEGYYSSVVFTYIMALGYPCIAEDPTNKGRIDLTIKLPDRIVVLEFKVDKKEKALAQIKEKQYGQKYQHEAKINNKELFIVGICFSSKEKNITEFEYVQII